MERVLRSRSRSILYGMFVIHQRAVCYRWLIGEDTSPKTEWWVLGSYRNLYVWNPGCPGVRNGKRTKARRQTRGLPNQDNKIHMLVSAEDEKNMKISEMRVESVTSRL